MIYMKYIYKPTIKTYHVGLNPGYNFDFVVRKQFTMDSYEEEDRM